MSPPCTISSVCGEEFQFERYLSVYVYDRDRPNKHDRMLDKVAIKRNLQAFHNKDHWFPIRPITLDSEVQENDKNFRIKYVEDVEWSKLIVTGFWENVNREFCTPFSKFRDEASLMDISNAIRHRKRTTFEHDDLAIVSVLTSVAKRLTSSTIKGQDYLANGFIALHLAFFLVGKFTSQTFPRISIIRVECQSTLPFNHIVEFLTNFLKISPPEI
ncbi:hypothetical protein PGB90_009905 [Kerria lacca]